MYRPKDIQERILHRFKIAKGHLQKVIQMIEEDQYCIDIIRQNQAVVAALKKANELILNNHLHTCVTSAIRGKNEDKRKQILKEIVQVFKEFEDAK